MRSFYFLVLLFSFAFSVSAQAPKWANYINDNLIRCMALEDDYLWVGSQAGLTKINRATGEKQSFLPSNSGLRGFGVRSIYIAPDGVKWIGGESGGLMRFDGTNWQQFNYINTSDTLIQISKIRAAPNGDLWLYSTINSYCGGCSKLLKFDGNTFARMDELFGPPNPTIGIGGTVEDFDIAPNGDVWVVTTLDSIKRFDGVSVIEAYSSSSFDLEYLRRVDIGPNGLPLLVTSKMSTSRIWQFTGDEWTIFPVNGVDTIAGDIHHVFMDADNNLWMDSKADGNGTPVIYYKFDGTTWQTWSSADLPNVPAGPPNSEPRLLQVDADGHWWCYYYTIGGIHAPKIFEFDGANWKGYNTEFFLLGNSITEDVGFDCEGNIWFGGNSLTRFDGSNWVDYKAADIGLTSLSFDIWSFTTDTVTCDLWMAFHDGFNNKIGFAKYDGSTFTSFSTPTGSDVFKVLIDPTSDIWVASSSDGLGHFDGNNWTWFNQNNSPLANYILDIAFDHDGKLWVATNGKGISVYNDSGWTTYNSTNSPVQDAVLWLYVDQSDNIWVWNSGSPLRFDGINWTSLTVSTGEGYDHLYSMAQDMNGKFWFGSYYAVYEYDGVNLKTYKIENSNIGADLAFKIRVDAYNNKWFVHGAGVSVFNENGITNLPIEPPNNSTGTTQVPKVSPTINIFPNPNNGSFWLETTGEGVWTATISDLSGRIVRQLKALGKKAKLDGLAAGFYIVTIKQDGHLSNGKVMVTQ